MNKVSVSLENCYGIKKLDYTFDFTRKKTNALYSPNGVMKTSFAKTLKDIQNGAETFDLIFPENTTKRIVNDETGSPITPDRILVVEPYNETYKSDKLSTLLVNAKLKNEYDKINIDLEDKKSALLDALKPAFGLKSGIDELIGSVFTKLPNGFFTAIGRIKSEVLSDVQPTFETIIYKNVFSDKSEEFLSSPEIRTKLIEYMNKYDELIGKSKYLSRGFNHTNASTIAKNLKDNGFFKAKHTVNLVSQNGKQEVKTEKELEDLIEKEKQDILSNPELKTIFDEIDEKISANKNLRDFRDYLSQNISIVPELTNLEAFKEKLILSYLKGKRELFASLAEAFEKGQKEMESIIRKANQESTQWSLVIDDFNQRFSVPFKLSIANQDQVILNAKVPVVKFEFTDGGITKNVEESNLLRVLSTGEKRALYLLNIIFEIRARIAANTKTLVVLDDVADSFDYKNKYAIVEYIKDNADSDIFHQIILTHNYDFFRTITSRLDMARENKLNTDKGASEITIFQETYQNNPLTHWKTKLETNDSMLIAAIPFARNIAEFSGDEENLNKLTSLLHYKEETDGITISDLQGILRLIFKDKANVVLANGSDPVLAKIFSVAESISTGTRQRLELEEKVCLAIAIRLKAEMYIVNELKDPIFWKGIAKNQSNALYEKYKEKFPDRIDEIKLLAQVNLMTPENIHINSFMYEPILDMSNHHLKSLYGRIKVLSSAKVA